MDKELDIFERIRAFFVKMHKYFGICILFVGVFAFTGCAPKLESGIVTNKTFAPAHNEEYTTYTKNGGVQLPNKRTGYVGDLYYVTITAEVNGKTRGRLLCITKTVYDNISIGDFLEVTDDIIVISY